MQPLPDPGMMVPDIKMPMASGIPWVPGMPMPPAGMPGIPFPGGHPHPQPIAHDTNDREARLMKRKQANRDSARRSKQKKKQEIADLSNRKAQLSEHNQDLVDRVTSALARVQQLQSVNADLREQYKSILDATAAPA